MDFKEAGEVIAARADDVIMPKDHADRIIEGAKHLSPHLGRRMAKTIMSGRPVCVSELMPQDLKVDTGRFDAHEAAKVAAYLGAVVGKAHSRHMSSAQRQDLLALLKKKPSLELNAPAWLWKTVVELLSIHEKAYLEQWRCYVILTPETN